MKQYIIKGGTPLLGEVTIGGAKNAALGIIVAAIMADEPVTIDNLPDVDDVRVLLDAIESIGAIVERIDSHTVRINGACINDVSIDEDAIRKIRGSYYLVGALLGKYKKALVALPGGCQIGSRPIDQHIKGFEQLGAKVSIENAAKEPHVVDVANFLNSMGANIKGAGTDAIRIRGVEALHGAEYSIIPDQIEAGTYMLAVAATGGDVMIKNVIPKHLEAITAKLVEIGAIVEEFDDCVRVCADHRLSYANVKTMPYPGFPTDMQPQITTLLALSEGTSIVTETIFETRFKYISELRRMGANISVEGNAAFVTGVEGFTGARVSAPDLRAGAALVMAGLVAEGYTYVDDIQYIERGYENFAEKIRGLGGHMEKIDAEDERAVRKFKMKVS